MFMKYAKLTAPIILGTMIAGVATECAAELVSGASVMEALQKGGGIMVTSVGIKKVCASEIIQRVVNSLMPTRTCERTI